MSQLLLEWEVWLHLQFTCLGVTDAVFGQEWCARLFDPMDRDRILWPAAPATSRAMKRAVTKTTSFTLTLQAITVTVNLFAHDSAQGDTATSSEWDDVDGDVDEDEVDDDDVADYDDYCDIDEYVDHGNHSDEQY
jgi:hypothetical protein